LEYLRKVHERHEEWLKTLKHIPILTVDTGVIDIYSENDQREVAQIIKTFIKDFSLDKSAFSNETIGDFT
jgi:deoxyadenosine/deoxycytidine kinase